MLFKPFFSLALKTSKDGENTASLGSFFHCVTFFILKKTLFISRQSPLFQCMHWNLTLPCGVVSLITYQAVQLAIYPDSQILFSCSSASQSLACIGASDYFFPDTGLYLQPWWISQGPDSPFFQPLALHEWQAWPLEYRIQSLVAVTEGVYSRFITQVLSKMCESTSIRQKNHEEEKEWRMLPMIHLFYGMLLQGSRRDKTLLHLSLTSLEEDL